MNDGADTHPAARILDAASGYRKAFHGPILAERIGLAVLRECCPHFNGWVSWLEGLGRGSPAGS